MEQRYYTIAKDVILRREGFGGLAFHRRSTISLEVDHEGFCLLKIIGRPSNLLQIKQQLEEAFDRDFSNSEIKSILGFYYDHGFIETSSVPLINLPSYNENTYHDSRRKSFATSGRLSSPETVHLSITGRCNLKCPFCYGKSDSADLSTTQLCKLIDELSSMKVFQLAIGGGEPFIRDDLFKIVEHCCQRDLIVNITTNGTLISDSSLKKLSPNIGQINLSYNEAMMNSVSSFYRSLSLLIKNSINVGVNLLATKTMLPDLEGLIKRLLAYPIKKVVILRPKPGNNEGWFKKNKLTKEELFKLKSILNRFKEKVYIDCSLICLMRGLCKQELGLNAVYGCVGGVRFCTIKNNGDVYPCSFFNTQEFLAGNILKSGFRDIWEKAQVFKTFSEMNNRLEGACQSCDIRDYCKGCRRIALSSGQGFYASEEECPTKGW